MSKSTQLNSLPRLNEYVRYHEPVCVIKNMLPPHLLHLFDHIIVNGCDDYAGLCVD